MGLGTAGRRGAAIAATACLLAAGGASGLAATDAPSSNRAGFSGFVTCPSGVGDPYQCDAPVDLGFKAKQGKGFVIRYVAGAAHCATAHLQIFISGKYIGKELVVPVGGDSGNVAVKAPRSGPVSVDVAASGGCAAEAGGIHSWSGEIGIRNAGLTRLSGRVLVRDCVGPDSHGGQGYNAACTDAFALGRYRTVGTAHIAERAGPSSTAAVTVAGNAGSYTATSESDGTWELEVPRGKYDASLAIGPDLQDHPYAPAKRSITARPGDDIGALDFTFCEIGIKEGSVFYFADGAVVDQEYAPCVGTSPRSM